MWTVRSNTVILSFNVVIYKYFKSVIELNLILGIDTDVYSQFCHIYIYHAYYLYALFYILCCFYNVGVVFCFFPKILCYKKYKT